MAHRNFGSQRMSKQWAFMTVGSNAFTANATAALGSLSFAEPGTVIRMLGSFIISGTSGGAFGAGDEACLAVAIGVVSTDAVAAGAGSLPDPGAEPEYPWLYWTEKVVFMFDGTLSESRSMSNWQVDFDVRSRRKLKPRESLVMVAEYSDITGTPPVTVSAARTRVLVAT